MAEIVSKNKRIAKNSIFLSLRMVVVLCVNLYTTRIILSILGIEDYGLYNVVCGFVSMFAFLNTSMSNGMQRFFNFELGRNGEEGANKVYNVALLTQIIIALIVIILTESLGLWYLHHKMIIPVDRFLAAEWIFQLSILSLIFIILQVPYTAAIMAHEKMNFYAFVSIMDVLLKLGIVFLIQYIQWDQLIVYSFLLFLVSVLNFLLTFGYSKYKFSEIKLKSGFQKGLFKSILSFSGWNFLGSFSNMMKEQGLNLVINIFFGPIINAARGIATQVNSGIQNFVVNISIAVRPQIVQSYAIGNIERTMRLTYSISKLSCFLLYMISLPIVLEINYILYVWLGGNIPNHTASFIFIIILTSFVNNLNSAISAVVHASGKMKLYQISGAVTILLAVPLAYLALKFGGSPEWAFIMGFLSMAFAQIVALFVLKTIIPFSIRDYIQRVIYPLSRVIVFSAWVPIVLHCLMPEGIIRFILVELVSIIGIGITVLTIGLNSPERNLVWQIFSAGKKKLRQSKIL